MITSFLLAFFLVNSPATNGQEAPTSLVVNDHQAYSLHSYCEYLVDSSNLSINEIPEQKFSSDYEHSVYGHMHPNWVTWQVTNNMEEHDFLLTIDQWQSAELYVFKNDSLIEQFISGTNLHISERPESLHRLLTFPIHLQQHDTARFYLKVSNQAAWVKYYASFYDFLAKMEWQTAKASRSKFINNQFVITLILGICFILALYNFILLLNNWRWDLAYLVAYILVTALFIANIHGITTNFLITGYQAYELPMGLILVHIVSILMAFYIRSYLHTRKDSLQNILLLFFIGYMAVSLVVSLITESSFLPLIRRYFEFTVLAVILFYSVYQKKEGTWFLIFAIFSAIVGRYISDFLATQLGILIRGDIPYLIGQLTQMMLFTWGSTFTVQRLEKAIKNVLRERQELLKQKNDELHATVKERTKDLEELSEKLLEGNNELRQQRQELQDTLDYLQKTQDQLIQSEKMASLGVLSAGIGHEINNPLNFIKGGLESLKMKLKNSTSLDEFRENVNPMIKIITEGVHRTTAIVKSLSHFSRANDKPDESCEVHTILDNCLIILFNQTKERVTINKEYMVNLPNVIGNEGRLHQALLNLLSNAQQAIEGKGTIALRTHTEEKKVIIEITDSGCGIPKENLNKISDPFFTTKPPGQGTGLGLSITYRIIDQHKGKVKCKSKVGKGTTFIVSLPMMET